MSEERPTLGKVMISLGEQAQQLLVMDDKITTMKNQQDRIEERLEKHDQKIIELDTKLSDGIVSTINAQFRGLEATVDAKFKGFHDLIDAMQERIVNLDKRFWKITVMVGAITAAGVMIGKLIQ